MANEMTTAEITPTLTEKLTALSAADKDAIVQAVLLQIKNGAINITSTTTHTGSIRDFYITYPDGNAKVAPAAYTTKGDGVKTQHNLPIAGTTTTGVLQADDFTRFVKASDRAKYIVTGWWTQAASDEAKENGAAFSIYGVVDGVNTELIPIPKASKSSSGALTRDDYLRFDRIATIVEAMATAQGISIDDFNPQDNNDTL